MAKHRKEGPINDVMVGDLYLGTQTPENQIGKIILTEHHTAVMVFDEDTVGRSVAKLLSPTGALPLSFTDERHEEILPWQTPTEFKTPTLF